MIKRYTFILAFLWISLFAGCGGKENNPGDNNTGVKSISVTLPGATSGTNASFPVKTEWAAGDAVVVNGVQSASVSSSQGSKTVTLPLKSGVTPPLRVYYPSDVLRGVNLPGSFVWSADGIDTSKLPLAGYSENEPECVLAPMYSIVRIDLLASEGTHPTISKVTLQSSSQISGFFKVDSDGLVSSGTIASSRQITANVNAALSESALLSVFFVVPSGTYPNGFTAEVKDSNGKIMHLERTSAITIAAGETYSFGQIPFVVENVITGNVAGHVVTSDGLPLSGVVVTDGFSCTSTDEFGFFQMESDLSKVRFIYISTPSGYEPPRRGGVPVFYKETGTLSAKQLQDLTFTLTARNHDKYTVFFTADPQPRNRTNGYDKIAYHSLDVCEDLYTDLRKNAASITDRPVYGICLGDIVHNTLPLLDDYTNGLATLGYPTYNVIGNHDYDRAASDDEKGGLVFEKYFGPLNYSFNLGNVHVLILDNLLMATDASTGKLTTVHYGLSDDTMTWLRNDLEYVSKDKTLFVCSHSPMFRFRKQEFSTGSGTRNGKEYATLLSSYPKVHIWSGHKHATFNYIYPSSGLYPGMECHSLARSTGPLWTNEYVVSGTPRGYTVVDVAGDEISWRFHPLQYQTAQYVRSSAPPAYEHRDWSYNSEGVAILRNGKELDESYQMKVYARGVYGDNYIYANIFLYDDLWGPVFFTPDGGSPVEMSRWTDAGRYDYATAEMTLFYKTDSSVLEDDSSWEDLATGYTDTIFRTPVDIGSGSGTVSATDRFGKTWTCRIEW